jgi:hypothetical protein
MRRCAVVLLGVLAATGAWGRSPPPIGSNVPSCTVVGQTPVWNGTRYACGSPEGTLPEGTSCMLERDTNGDAVCTTPVSLADPNANRLVGWDDTDGAVKLQLVVGATYDAATDTWTVDKPSANVNASDGTWRGMSISRTVATGANGELFGQVMYVEADGEFNAADADATTTMPGVCVLVTAGEGASKDCVISGTVTETDWNWTPGAILYVSTDPATTTGLTATAPSGTGDQVQVVGIALSADTILVQPSLVLVAVP